MTFMPHATLRPSGRRKATPGMRLSELITTTIMDVAGLDESGNRNGNTAPRSGVGLVAAQFITGDCETHQILCMPHSGVHRLSES